MLANALWAPKLMILVTIWEVVVRATELPQYLLIEHCQASPDFSLLGLLVISNELNTISQQEKGILTV